MPFAVINRVVIDPLRRTEGQSAVRAAREHYVGAGGKAEWLHTGQHVNVVVSRAAGTIHRQEQLPRKSLWIDRVGEIQIAAQVDLNDLVKRRRYAWILCVA